MGLFGSWFDDLLGGSSGAMPATAPISTTPTQAPIPAPAQPDAVTQLQQLLLQRANPSPWQKIAGGLGGALSDFSAVRSGHPEMANQISGYFGGVDQAKTGLLAQNALHQTLGDASSGTDGQLPSDLPLKLAKLQALGVDITPIQTYIANRNAMQPKYTRDDMGNVWAEVPGQPPKLITVGPGKPTTVKDKIIPVNPYAPGAAQPQAGQASAPQAQPGFASFYQNFLAPHEGGYTPSDGNGAPANFGINQKSNPDVNVATLTPDKAQQIMHDRYWVPSGADQLPPALGAIQADTAVNMGVGAAKQLLQQSGGDPQKYLELRARRYQAIAARDPSKAASLPVWLKRNQDLAQYASTLGPSSPAPAPQQAGVTPNQPLYDAGPEVTPIGQASPQLQKEYAGAVAIDGNGKPIYPPGYQAGMPQFGAADATASNLHGQDYLKTISPQIATQVKALAEGRMAFPSGFALKSPYWQNMLQAVSQYDPSFDAVNYNSRSKTRNDFTSGKSAQNITAMNTALQHAGVVADALSALHNTSIPMVNTAKNWLSEELGNAAPTNARESVDALASEGRKVFAASGGGNLTELENWQKNFPINGSPEQQQGALKQFAALLRSRIESLGAQYNHGMGTTADPLKLLSPKAQQTIQKLEGGGQSTTPGQPSPQDIVNELRRRGVIK